MEIKEDYCNFETAKLLKEKGFYAETNTYYYATSEYTKSKMYKSHNNTNWNNNEYYYSAPTHQMAMKWLREKGIHISPKYCCFQGSKRNDEPYYKWEDRVLRLSTNNQVHPQLMGIHKYYNTYEEAVEAALKYSLENLI